MRSPKPSEQHLRGATFVVAGLLALLLVVTAAGVLARTGKGGTDAKVRPVWTWSPPMPHRRSYTASAQIGGKIYVAAGMVGNSGRPLDLFEHVYVDDHPLVDAERKAFAEYLDSFADAPHTDEATEVAR